MNILFFVFCIVLLIMFVAFCIAVYKYKGLPLVLKAAAWFLILAFIKQTVIYSFWYLKQNNLFLFHIGVITDAVPLFLMYREMFKKHIEAKEIYVYRKIFIALIAFFVVFAVVNALCWQSLTTYPSNTRTVLNIMIMLFSMLHFYKYTYEPIPKEHSEFKDYARSTVPLFWINMGLILFTSYSILVSIFGDIFFNGEKSTNNNLNIPIAYAGFCIILYTFIGIGFIKAPKIHRKKKS